MRRYWLPQSAKSEHQFVIEGDSLHHIRSVCRMVKGSKFEILTDEGHAYLVEIINETKHASLAEILETRQLPEIPRPWIRLILSVPRFPVFEAVIEKAVELGVHSVHPIFSDFSFIRKQEDVFNKKRERFEKIIVGATQQSGRANRMHLADVRSLEELLIDFNRTASVAGLFAYEGAGQLSAKGAVDAMTAKEPKEIWIFVGSEGGFSEKEVELFQTHQLAPVTLGQQVLRVETACVALISVIKYGFDQMR